MAKRETKLTLADIQQNADELNKKNKNFTLIKTRVNSFITIQNSVSVK